MEKLPDIPEELFRYELLIRFDPLSLLKYCKASKDSKKYCNDPSFMKTYNKNISHDDYQLLVLKEAYKGKYKSFLKLKYKSEFFDQIVDERTLKRAILYFSELTDTEFSQKVDATMYYLSDLRRGVNTLRKIIEIIHMADGEGDGDKSDLELTPENKEIVVNYIYSAIYIVRDHDYIANFFISNLQSEEIATVFKLTIVSEGAAKRRIPEAILGAILETNNLNLFNRLIDVSRNIVDSENLIIYSVTKYGTLEQYKSIFGNRIENLKGGHTPTSHNRDLYLYLYKKVKDIYQFLDTGYYALDPYEWIDIIKNLQNDKDIDKRRTTRILCEIRYNIPEIVRLSENLGYTYWSEVVNKSNLKNLLLDPL